MIGVDGGGLEQQTECSGTWERRLSAILAVDIVGYTRLMQSDEAGTLIAARHCRAEILSPRIAKNRGRIVKHTGDGMLVEFSSVVNAVACAIDIQRDMAEQNRDLSQDRRIELRMGINLGDVVVEDGDIFGEGVNLAARLEAIAEPGGIAVSASVRDHVGSRLGLIFEDRGDHWLKNIAHDVRVYAVTLEESTASSVIPIPFGEARKRLVAVLPFVNFSDDCEQEYFSDGMTEDIITDLSQISGLNLVPRNTMFTYKGKSVKVKHLAQELGADFVLQGSVRKAGRRIRITGQLIDARNGMHLWAGRFDRDLTDIFAVQDEITHAIVAQLRVRLLPEEKKAIESEPTVNVDAYTYHLRGRQFLNARTRTYVLLARRMFLKAVELDPNYARAYAAIADCDSTLRDWSPSEFALEDILATSAKALELDPHLAEAYASHGLVLHQSGQNEEAAAAFVRALALQPNLYEAHFHNGRFLYMQGRFAEAVHSFERAASLHPDDYLSPVHLMSAFQSLGKPEERRHWARIGVERSVRALDRNPENSGPAHRGAIALAHLGEVERAREWAVRALTIDPDDIVAQYNVACAYAIIGDKDAALDLLEKLLPQSSAYQVLWFSNDSDLGSLRDLPRFRKMFERFAE
jgi:adenylate cyclase